MGFFDFLKGGGSGGTHRTNGTVAKNRAGTGQAGRPVGKAKNHQPRSAGANKNPPAPSHHDARKPDGKASAARRKPVSAVRQATPKAARAKAVESKKGRVSAKRAS